MLPAVGPEEVPHSGSGTRKDQATRRRLCVAVHRGATLCGDQLRPRPDVGDELRDPQCAERGVVQRGPGRWFGRGRGGEISRVGGHRSVFGGRRPPRPRPSPGLHSRPAHLTAAVLRADSDLGHPEVPLWSSSSRRADPVDRAAQAHRRPGYKTDGPVRLAGPGAGRPTCHDRWPRLDTRLMAMAMTPVPKTYDSKACPSATFRAVVVVGSHSEVA
jgi:hypothetical protein